MKEEAKEWIERAESDLRKAKILFDGKEYDGTNFYAQQSVEKAMKAVYLAKGFGLIKTHDLLLLSKKINAPEKIMDKAISLNPFYTSSRYPLGNSIKVSDKSNAEESIKFVEEILKWCRQQLKI